MPDTPDARTEPQPVDAAGFTLDAWGLPLCGPARVAALAGKPDPRDPAPAAPAVTPSQD